MGDDAAMYEAGDAVNGDTKAQVPVDSPGSG
jgi:hypothetical protein